jgi:hypothetical protein
MREDTKPETPHAKSSSEPPPAPDAWRRPKSDASHLNNAGFGAMTTNGARLDWGFGGAKVRTLQASGPAAMALTILVLLAIGALVSLFFVFAIGLGAVVALGAGALAVLGLGAKMVRRRLGTTRHPELGPGK